MASIVTKEDNLKYDDWKTFIKDNNIYDIRYDISWHIMFSIIKKNPKFKKTSDKIIELVNNGDIIYPKPKLLFNALYITPATDLKVVILGQDPYINHDSVEENISPQAMGLSFSAPYDMDIPKSLMNIYKNLQKFKHIKNIPSHPNLLFLAIQGILFLNASFTVESKKPKSHSKIWSWMSNEIIQYISDNFDNIVFMIWGNDAYKKVELIDLEKHHIIVSSHPSPLSCNKDFKNYKPFMNVDHFGLCNKYLEENFKNKIIF